MTREECLDEAFNTLATAREKAETGLIAEAQQLTGIAQTMLALADRAVAPVQTTLTGGPH